MSGIEIVQTGKDIGAFFNSWITYVNSAQQYNANPNDSAAKQGLISSANALSSAIATVGKNQLFASTLGTLAGVGDMPIQVSAYQTAVATGKINDQTAALSSIAGDAASIAGTAATTVGAWAKLTQNSGLADLMGEVAEHANDFALAVGAVGTAVDVGNWFNSTFLPGFNKWIGNTPQQLDEDMLLNLNDSSGNLEIIMPGQSGDSLTETPLSGNAFQYVEANSGGSQVSSVVLAMNGTTVTETISGQGIVSDVSNFQINLNANASATIDGSADTANVNGSGSIISIGGNGQNATTANDDHVNFASGVSGTVNLSANSRAEINGNGITVNAAGNDTTGVYGTGDIVNFVSNTGSLLDLYTANSSTAVNGAGNAIGIFAAGDNVTASGETITVNSGFGATVAGGNDTIQLSGSGDTLVLSGGSGYTVRGGLNDTISVYGPQTDNISMTSGSELFYTQAGVKTADELFSAGVETDYLGFSSAGVETYDEKFNTAGQETDYDLLASNGQITQDEQFNVSTGKEVDALNYTNGVKTDEVYYNSGGVEANDEFFNSTGIETSNIQFDATGHKSDIQYFSGAATNNYETDQINFNVATGGETSELDYNPAGKETDVLNFIGTATNDYETNRINFSTTTGGETSELDYNPAGKETDVLNFIGTATNDYETNRINYNVSTGGETSELDYNPAGKETDVLNFIGTATNDYETNRINFSTTTGGE
ncbi:beta strand repeat-containing protein, partial [Paraburkholderia caffeinitolerans]|uniref:beta strand repeat-containing protein n=1 Tax=Paraburkholderia caffeinitolerans TaxID=1723730 RepID=UPI0015824D41